MRQVIRELVAPTALAFAIAAIAEGRPGPEPPCPRRTAAFTVTVTGIGNRPMILIPGLLSSGQVWDGVVHHFSSRYRLHVLTIAGFAGVPPVGGALLPRVRDELVAYIRANGLDQPVLVGHSLGGFLALWVASTAPDAIGPVVLVDGVPFQPALSDPAATAAGMEPLAERMRAMYRSMSPQQIGQQSGTALARMISDPAKIATVAAWAGRSDGGAVGQALYELMTTDLREEVRKIRSDVLLVAAVKRVASMPERLGAALGAYEGQVAGVPRHQVVAAREALHFVMLDDAPFLLASMDEFLARASSRPAAGER
jgi:pimeloyl-ACP methyl ester carboxylesterase